MGIEIEKEIEDRQVMSLRKLFKEISGLYEGEVEVVVRGNLDNVKGVVKFSSSSNWGRIRDAANDFVTGKHVGSKEITIEEIE
jgi:hypothetical protein